MPLGIPRTLSQDATEESKKDKKKSKGKGAPSLLGGIGSALTGPVGGALITAGAGAVDANRADKATAPGRPKRRRLTAAHRAVNEVKGKQERALATLSQAVFDWAANIR